MSAPRTQAGRQPHRLRTGSTNRSHELVGDDACTYEPLDVMQSCPAEEKQARTAPAAALLEVGVAQRPHGVLAAELEADADQARRRRAWATSRPVRGGAGEADVVGVLDDGLADDGLPSPSTTCSTSSGSPASISRSRRPTGRSARSRVGAASRRRCRRAKAGRASPTDRLERVVPRRDDGRRRPWAGAARWPGSARAARRRAASARRSEGPRRP